MPYEQKANGRGRGRGICVLWTRLVYFSERANLEISYESSDTDDFHKISKLTLSEKRCFRMSSVEVLIIWLNSHINPYKPGVSFVGHRQCRPISDTALCGV